MKTHLRHFLQSEKGATLVETALTIVFFLVILAALLEFCRMAVVGGCMDWAVSQTAKEVKNDVRVTDYRTAFEQRIKENFTAMSACQLVDNGEVNVNIRYFATPDKLARNETTSDVTAPLALYEVSYLYHPLLGPVPEVLTDELFKRNVVVVQEYERRRIRH